MDNSKKSVHINMNFFPEFYNPNLALYGCTTNKIQREKAIGVLHKNTVCCFE